MIELSSQAVLKKAIADCINTDRVILDNLRDEIRVLKDTTHRIQPRAATSISLVGTDGGNNQLSFDPFLVQLIRVVDSSNNEYCLEAVSPETPLHKLDKFQFEADGRAKTALGKMMNFLNIKSLSKLSHMIRLSDEGRSVFPRRVEVYRELVEWAVLFALLEKDFGTDTLIICDGLLRSMVFSGDLFHRLLKGMEERIENQWKAAKRKIYLAGIAKRSKVLSRYHLAAALEGILQTDYPAYVEVPREIEEKAYIWPEFARGDDRVDEKKEINRFVGGKMFLVKFGSHQHDPIWPVDIFLPQKNDAQIILGSMLADSIMGFPIPCYPRCLQKAHENAALVDFDLDILQDYIYEGVRRSLDQKAEILDALRLQDSNPAQLRYE
jgi:hypothetical protein